MGYFSCSWPDEHKREGRDDFDRYGRYGYDSFKYEDPFDDCNRAYTDGFNEARREDERREERREEERREEHRQERERVERRRRAIDEEEAEYAQMPEYPPHERPTDDLPF